MDQLAKSHSSVVLNKAEISIWLDSYDDIFSDFDPRPVSVRSLSDDFVSQVKKTQRESKAEKAVLKLLMPSALRKTEEESRIIDRLHTYFNTIHQQLRDEAKATNTKGVYFIFAGITFMVVAGFLSFSKSEKFHMHLLLVLFEPAGWFLLWTGLDHLIYFGKTKRSELYFYGKMTNAEIEFHAY
jgi:hypothetical protein